jgi:DNA-binding NarL/FixJ family response regulator
MTTAQMIKDLPETHLSANETKKILIVDDHPITRRGLIQLLSVEKNLEICGEAESTDQAIELIQKQSPDLVILDLSLKDSNGIDFIKSVKKWDDHLRILVVSMHHETILVERTIRAGARGYVTKQEAVDHLLTAVKQVLDGKFYLSDATKERTLESQFSKAQDSGLSSLSDRELEIFQLVGQELTIATIAKNLHLNIKTVEGYRAGIRAKLKLKDNMELIRHAMRWHQTSQQAA